MIVGQRTRLRAIERSDIPAFLRWLNDPEVRRHVSRVLPISQAEEERWFEGLLGDDSRHIFAVDTSEGEHIGSCGLHDLDWKNRNAVCGIVIGDKSRWNQGYGTDALRTLLRFAFEELNLHRVFLHVYGFNQRAIRCYEKVGFRHEARLRERRFTAGRYVDDLVMGILRDEWNAQGDRNE
jgi:RimJ/RimL family protein N-acetyltransferase